MKNYKTILSVVFILSLISLMGCQTMSSQSESSKEVANLDVAPLLKFQDIPTPSGFQFAPKESYTVQAGNFRVGLLQYVGKGTMDQVLNFYKNQMPAYNWNIINVIQHETSVITLEKSDQSCIITISPKNSNTMSILISVAPKSATSSVNRSKKSSEEIVK